MLVDINLLPQKEKDQPVILFAAIGMVLMALVVWAIFFFLAQSQANSQAAIDAEYSQVAAESEALRTELEALVGMTEEQQLKATVDWAESYQFDTVPLLADLVVRLPERGFFNSFSFIKPNEATLMVQFDTAREAAYYLAQLKKSELITSAKLDSVVNEEMQEAEEEVLGDQEEKIIENPRYLATYSLVYIDDRIPNIEIVEAADGTVTPAAEETTETDAGTEETETAPEETEGDAQ